MNIKTLLTDEEKIKLAVQYVRGGSQDVIDLVIASVDAQDAKTKRVRVEWLEKRLVQTVYLDGNEQFPGGRYFYLTETEWQEFKK